MSNTSEKLKIRIPSVEKQFRIETIPGNHRVGTKITVRALKNKITENGHSSEIGRLDISGYLTKIAGFVDFPVSIKESGKETTILNPNESDHNRQGFTTSLSLTFPWQEAFEPQSLKLAKEFFQERVISIENDLSWNGTKGAIVYLVPRTNIRAIRNIGSSWPGRDFLLLDQNGVGHRVQITEKWGDYYSTSSNTFGNSAHCLPHFKFFLNGILVSGVHLSSNMIGSFKGFHFIDYFANPYIVLNVPRKNLEKIDLARSVFLGNDKKWNEHFEEKLLLYLQSEEITKLLKLESLKERLLGFARLLVYFRVSPKIIADTIPLKRWPVPIISGDGRLNFVEWEEFLEKSVYLKPTNLTGIESFFENEIIGREQSVELDFEGHDFLPLLHNDYQRVCEFSAIASLLSYLLKETHVSYSTCFFSSQESIRVVSQSVYSPIKVFEDIKCDDYQILNNAAQKIEILTKVELQKLVKILRQNIMISQAIPKLSYFSAPYQECFGYGVSLFNLEHQNSKFILATLSNLLIKEDSLAAIDKGVIIEKIQELPLFKDQEYQRVDLDKINKVFEELFELNKANNFYVQMKPGIISENSFIRGSIQFEGPSKLISLVDIVESEEDE